MEAMKSDDSRKRFRRVYHGESIRDALYIGARLHLPARVYHHKSGTAEGRTKNTDVRNWSIFVSTEENLEGALLLERRWKAGSEQEGR